jgi:putative ABC transport system permease protein
MPGVERLRNAWRGLRAKGAASALESGAFSRRRKERVCFGPFEADLRTHELWRDGARIKLVGQPFVVLEMLLASPGDLITRDELRARLWPGDTFVGFDHGLNAAVNRLREILGDSATDPRYVETLPRRGYRFIAKVERRAVIESSPRVWVEPKKTARPSRLATGVRAMGGLFRDMRFAFRQIRTSPGFATVAILTLALGIGASTVIFSIVYNGVLYPFPYRSAERLTAIYVEDTEGKGARGMFPLSDVKALREGNHTFEDILAYGLWHVKYTKGNTAQMLKGVGATPEAKDFWGVPPLLGRWFCGQDVQTGAPPVVLLNYRYWNKEFHGDKDVLGQTMMLNGKSRTIIGIMPPRFQAVGADLYMPVSWTRPEPVRGRFEWDLDDPVYFWATGILKPGITLETAAADVDVIFRQVAPTHPDDYPKKFRVVTKWLNELIMENSRQTFFLLFAAVGLLLFIACSNVAGLLLARASARTREIALRAALGAGRGRLVRQLLSESLVLAMAGCALGCALAYLGMKGIMLLPLQSILPMESEITLNRPVLLFAIGISLVATLLCGIAPAYHIIRGDLQKSLTSTGVNVGAVFQHNRFRSGLVVGQVALSLILLTGAGLIARSFFALTRADLGVQPENIFTADVHFPKGRYTKAEEKTAFFNRLLPQLHTIPGIVSETELIGMPVFFAPTGDVTIPGKTHNDKWNSQVEMCSEGYFSTVNLHLMRGRWLTESDIEAARRVTVVNESLARRFFAGEDPIGEQIKFNVFDELPETPHDAYFEIVGVVNDTRGIDFENKQPPRFLEPGNATPKGFVPYSFSGFGDRSIAMLTRVPPNAIANNVRQILWSMDPDVVLVGSELTGGKFALSDFLNAVLYDKPRFAAIAFAACASLGFLLAIIGLFSVMTYIVSLKTHDIGIRLALGASREAILQLVMRRGFLVIITGVVIGVAASLVLTRFVASQLTGVSATDPLTLIGVVLTVMLAGLLACFLPARRATLVEPMATLRNE